MEPLIAFSFAMDAPFHVDETVAVFVDGSAWLWSLGAASLERRDTAGTFTAELDDATTARIGRLADLVAGGAGSGTPPQRGLQLTVTTAGRSLSFALPASGDDDPVLQELAAVADDLIAATARRPLSAARASARAFGPRIARGQTEPALLVVSNPGAEAVTFLLRPEAIAFWDAPGSGGRELWANVPNVSMGLLDSRSNLVDGIHVAAVLPPGGTATAVFLDALRPGPETEIHLAALVEGWIALLRPGEPPPAAPASPFWLITHAARIEVG